MVERLPIQSFQGLGVWWKRQVLDHGCLCVIVDSVVKQSKRCEVFGQIPQVATEGTDCCHSDSRLRVPVKKCDEVQIVEGGFFCNGCLMPVASIHKRDEQTHFCQASHFTCRQLQLVSENEHLDGVYRLCHPPCVMHRTWCTEAGLIIR